jgi:hypothetical protein
MGWSNYTAKKILPKIYIRISPALHITLILCIVKQEKTMKTTKALSIFLLIVALLLSACERNISRNNDGSFDIETTISQQELQDVISASIADPLIKELTVSLQSGYVLVSGTRERLNDSSKTDTLNFHLDLGVSNGQLTSSISDVQLDGAPIEQSRIDHWNQTIANRIAIIGQKNPNSTLKSVLITPNAVTMTWVIDK